MKARSLYFVAFTPRDSAADSLSLIRPDAAPSAPGADEASTPPRLTFEELFQWVGERVRLQDGPEGVTTLHVALKPEHLGEVTLDVSWQDGGVSARFLVQDPQALAVLEGNLHRLEETLREQGLTVLHLQTSLAEDAGGWAMGREREDTGAAAPFTGRVRAGAARESPVTGRGSAVLNVLA